MTLPMLAAELIRDESRTSVAVVFGHWSFGLFVLLIPVVIALSPAEQHALVLRLLCAADTGSHSAVTSGAADACHKRCGTFGSADACHKRSGTFGSAE